MKIGIVETGAVGGFFGGKLSLAGFEVVFLSMGKTLDALKTKGLILETKEKIFIIKSAIFTDDSSQLKGCDYILFTVKSYDTESVINQIKNYITDETLVITQQNGINNDLILAEVLGKENVIPALTKGGYSSPSPGHFRNVGFAAIEVGEYNGKISVRLKDFATFFKSTGINVTISGQIQTERWKKYIVNCTFNIISAITKLRIDQILNNSEIRNLCIRTMKELIIISKKEGIILNEKETINGSIMLAKKLGPFKTSTLQDIEKGKPIELEAFTGYVLELAQKHRLKIPINETLYALLYGITKTKLNLK